MSVKITYQDDKIVHVSVSREGKKTFDRDFDSKLQELGKKDDNNIKTKIKEILKK